MLSKGFFGEKIYTENDLSASPLYIQYFKLLKKVFENITGTPSIKETTIEEYLENTQNHNTFLYKWYYRELKNYIDYTVAKLPSDQFCGYVFYEKLLHYEIMMLKDLVDEKDRDFLIDGFFDRMENIKEEVEYQLNNSSEEIISEKNDIYKELTKYSFSDCEKNVNSLKYSLAA